MENYYNQSHLINDIIDKCILLQIKQLKLNLSSYGGECKIDSYCKTIEHPFVDTNTGRCYKSDECNECDDFYQIGQNSHIDEGENISLNKSYIDLNILLESYTDEELPDDEWVDRTYSHFLRNVGLYNWGNNYYVCTTIETLYDPILNAADPELNLTIKRILIQIIQKLKKSVKFEDKICAIYGAPILFKKREREPHAYIIYKDTNSNIFYVYNGRGNVVSSIYEHLVDAWGDELVISPIQIPIQSYADGLEIDPKTEVGTKIRNYKGLCFPVVVVCAYLFMHSDATFNEMINYLYTKNPDELSYLFLQMNNALKFE